MRWRARIGRGYVAAYFSGFADGEALGVCQRPFVPANCSHNGHIFYLIMNNVDARNDLLSHLHHHGISATFHYIPLHESIAGKKFGRTLSPLPHTNRAGHCLIRLPLFPDLTDEQQDRVINLTNDFLFNAKIQKNVSTLAQ